jgi:hypothetical protein
VLVWTATLACLRTSMTMFVGLTVVALVMLVNEMAVMLKGGPLGYSGRERNGTDEPRR